MTNLQAFTYILYSTFYISLFLYKIHVCTESIWVGRCMPVYIHLCTHTKGNKSGNPKQKQTHRSTRTHTHARTHARTQAHTHTHTHTHTHSPNNMHTYPLTSTSEIFVSTFPVCLVLTELLLSHFSHSEYFPDVLCRVFEVPLCTV